MQKLTKVISNPATELFVLSFASLYLELLVIRWMSGDIHAFSIFKTFPLVTCYVGLGVGCALGTDRHFKLLPITLAILACVMKVPDLLDIWQSVAFPSASGFSDWGAPGAASQNIWLYMVFFMPFLILVLVGPFGVMASLGSRLGVLFNMLKPLHAYAVNIGGAVAGSVTFSVLSFNGMAPWQMLVPPCVVLYAYMYRQGKMARWSLVPLALTVLIAAWSPSLNFNSTITYPPNLHVTGVPPAEVWTYWSPYQRLDVVAQRFVTTIKDKTEIIPLGVNVFSNRRGYQAAMELAPDSFRKYHVPVVLDFLSEYRRRYHLPFQFQPPGEVLVVGAGSGTDVKEALNSGATHIDAVDIDPTIINIGKNFNPGKPYQDPKVTIICDDARNFFNHCKKHYDLIVYSHLDSLAAVGQGASVRVDNYVYTKESFKTAFQLLKPNGLMVVSFCTKKDWFRDRLFCTIQAALGYPPLVINDLRSSWLIPNTFFVAGEAVERGTLNLPGGESSAFSIAKAYKPQQARVLTDDWPYLYVQPGPIDLPYLLVVLEIILISLFAGRKVLFGPADFRDWQLFFMGGAFLLLELQSISRLSLLYGSSWFTSAVVINAVLLMILAANFLVIARREWMLRNKNILYVCLFATLLTSYFIPANDVLQWGAASLNSGYFIVTLFTSLPMFVAGLIFSTSFSEATNPRRALAFNLLGSVLGALLEYLSNYWGVSSLVLVAAGLYLLSWISLLRQKEKLSAEA